MKETKRKKVTKKEKGKGKVKTGSRTQKVLKTRKNRFENSRRFAKPKNAATR